MQAKRKFRVGWDVGAWHCDRGKSRDALVILESSTTEIVLAGKPWRGNLREALIDLSKTELINKFLSLCEIHYVEAYDFVIAIDTPLGWPKTFVDLISSGAMPKVSGDYSNPYTRRKTEIDLINKGKRPLSAIRDMIGSQSTKGIHFLNAANLRQNSPGVWRGTYSDTSVTAIETYPAAINQHKISNLFGNICGNSLFLKACAQDKYAKPDIEDALRCAIVAHFFADHLEAVCEIPSDCPQNEGWIVLPKET